MLLRLFHYFFVVFSDRVAFFMESRMLLLVGFFPLLMPMLTREVSTEIDIKSAKLCGFALEATNCI